jgi:hypothetical protein
MPDRGADQCRQCVRGFRRAAIAHEIRDSRIPVLLHQPRHDAATPPSASSTLMSIEPILPVSFAMPSAVS